MGTQREIVGVAEAAEILGISEQQVRYHARRGRLRQAASAGVWQFWRDEVEAYRENLEGLTPREVAELLSVTHNTVIRWAQTGKIDARQVGGRWRCTPQGVRAVAEDRGVIIPEGVLGGDTPKVL